MKWIKASERLPEEKKANYIFRQINRTLSAKIVYPYFTPNVSALFRLPLKELEWLDETQSVTKQEASEDELWEEALWRILKDTGFGQSADVIIQKLKQHYSIKKK